MTTQPPSYIEAALANARALRPPGAAPVQQAAVEYTPADIDALRSRFSALPASQQADLVQAMTAHGISGTQSVARYLDAATQPTPAPVLQPALPASPAFATVTTVSATPTQVTSTADALDYVFGRGPTLVPNLKGGPARSGPDFA